MFSIGDYVVYGHKGVCQVEAVGSIDKSDKLYYTLEPVYSENSKVFTPVENKKVPIRPVISQDTATELLNQVEDIEALWVPDERRREDCYKEAIRSCDCKEWFKIIRTLYKRQQERLEQGKKVTAKDEKYLRIAEDYLYGELALVFHLDKNEVPDYIQNVVEQNNASKPVT